MICLNNYIGRHVDKHGQRDAPFVSVLKGSIEHDLVECCVIYVSQETRHSKNGLGMFST